VRRLLEGYWQSLKPAEVEEPIDVWIHRPLAYLLARILLPTSISPNVVTIGSIISGLLALSAMLANFPGHMPLAGLCVFLSAVADCADGQLARMRGTSSAMGRMLDGAADFVVSIAIVGGAACVVLRDHTGSWREFTLFAVAVAFTGVTGSFHTASYDHYKNLFLRLTHPKYHEGEDLDVARKRHAEAVSVQSVWVRAAWPIYLFYLKSQVDYIRGYDPYTTCQLNRLPTYTSERAAIYRKHNSSMMRQWRTWFGFGSLTFGLAVATATNLLGLYLILRGVLLNIWYFAYMMPRQRRASREAFQQIDISVE
jgi:phosphatidylglycerophosphate synthase